MKSLKRNLIIGLVVLFGYLSSNYTIGPAKYSAAGGRTGAPFNSNLTCSSTSGCHTSAGVFTPVTTVELIDGSNSVTTYTSNKSYIVRITMTSATGITSATRYSFQMACAVTSTNADINNWGTMPTGTHKWTYSGRNYVEHSTQLTSNVINIPWTSPATSTGNITFYASGQIVNNNFQESGDNVSTTILSITPAGSCTAPGLVATPTHVKCKGDSAGSIYLNVTGGTSPFIYQWSGPGNFQASTQNVTKLVAGNYKVLVTAKGGCKDSVSITVTEPLGKVSATASSMSPYCTGDPIIINGSGIPAVGGALTYNWKGPGNTTYGTKDITFSSSTPMQAGDYILTVTDTTGCAAQDTAKVVVNDKPHVDSIILVPSSTSAFTFIAAGAQFVQSFDWKFDDGSNGNVDSIYHAYTSYGVYNVRLIFANNCGTDSLFRQIVAIPVDVIKYKGSELLKIYPNPANDVLNVEGKAGSSIEALAIYSMQGLKLFETKPLTKSTRINTNSLPAGNYLLSVDGRDTKTIQRLNIVH